MQLKTKPTPPPPISLEERQALEKEISFVLNRKKHPSKETPITPFSRLTEEDFYAAIVIHKLNGALPKTAERFRELFSPQVETIREKHKTALIFTAADRIMRALIRSGDLSRDLYRSIRDFAFGKAQFDSDRTWLSTKRAPDARSGDTPLRAISTAFTKYAANAAATGAEIAAYRERVAQLSAEKFLKKKNPDR